MEPGPTETQNERRSLTEPLQEDNFGRRRSLSPSASSRQSDSEEHEARDAKEAADLHAAYMERKKKAKERRAQRAAVRSNGSTLHTRGFLSNLPEVHANISYRFALTVVGDAAEQISISVCSNQMAEKMNIPGAECEPNSPEAYRCHAPIPFPPNAAPSHLGGVPNPERFTSDVPMLARLIFTPLPLKTEIPVYRTRFEALSSALVFLLVINPRPNENNFHRQILSYERAVAELHFHSKPLRPARAVILGKWPSDESAEADAAADSTHPPWEMQLRDLELVEENLWKFGPIDLTDTEAMHATFATIASARILRKERSGGDESDGSQDSDAPPQYEAEADPARDFGQMEAWMMTQLADPYSYEAPDEDGPGSGSEDLSSPKRVERFKHDWLSPIERGAA
mmetsp:Transcript_6490/g.15820  ORF Transcript_6490/g.15820 Transcript_6490/m.15820 type:complete len:398 (-) Transcript_6490:40-1233(-)